MLMPDPSDPTDRYAALRAHAAARKQGTIDRLRVAIMALEAEGSPITTFTIKQASGLDYMAYYRNAEALALFRCHSTHLLTQRAKRRTKTRKRGDTGPQDLRAPRDPLLNYPKPRLVVDLRAAQAGHDRLRQQYTDLLQEHMHCGLAIARLEAQVAEYQDFLDRFRASLRDSEQGVAGGREQT